jgi:hypothetical protein
MALAIACGQAGIGLGSLVAGATYGPFGYGLNTFIGAGGIFVMAIHRADDAAGTGTSGALIGEEKQAA